METSWTRASDGYYELAAAIVQQAIDDIGPQPRHPKAMATWARKTEWEQRRRWRRIVRLEARARETALEFLSGPRCQLYIDALDINYDLMLRRIMCLYDAGEAQNETDKEYWKLE